MQTYFKGEMHKNIFMTVFNIFIYTYIVCNASYMLPWTEIYDLLILFFFLCIANEIVKNFIKSNERPI